jgi:alpha-ketoglutarate-dependent taurine dioxygenase
MVEVLEQKSEQIEIRAKDTRLSGRIVWSKDTLAPTDGLVSVPPECLAEVDAMVQVIRNNQLKTELLEPGFFELTHCRLLMQRAKAELVSGVGFVIIDKFDPSKYSEEENNAVYWTLMQLIERPVAQDKKGNLFYDVRDEGKPVGNGVRPVLTAVGQPFHTDNNFNLCPPDYVALYCLQTAMEGGINSIVSFYTVYNEMLAKHPELVERLHQPFLFDRQREHADGEPEVISHPVFEYRNGALICRFSIKQVTNGYLLAKVQPDEVGQRALQTLESLMREPKYQKEFYFTPGQMQIVDNLRCGHRRTAFTDYPEPERRRHLLRLWLRGDGRRFYNG